MLAMTLTIVVVLILGNLLMSTEQVNHINRAAVAIFCGVTVWILYMIHGGDYLRLMHPEEYALYLDGAQSTSQTVKDFVSENIIVRYISQACGVILFLISTNTMLEVLNNNGVFDPLRRWLRMRNSRAFLWILSLLTFVMSANVDNMTTVVLMIALVAHIIRSHYQKVIYACVIMVSASMGGCVSVIGDMTSLMLWNAGLVTPTALTTGMIVPAATSTIVFNLLMCSMLKGNVEAVSVLGKYDGDDYTLSAWQRVFMLVLGIVGLWFIPTFHNLTSLPPYLGAMCVLALVWVVEGIFNFDHNAISLFVQRHYFRSTEFIGMRIILYFLGVTLGIGVLVECGALDYLSLWLEANLHDVYIYGIGTGLLSAIIDNVPIIMAGINLFPLDTAADSTSPFVQNGAYWQLLSFSAAIGGALLFVGTLAGQAILQVERIRTIWLIRHYAWRVALAWVAGMAAFYLTH